MILLDPSARPIIAHRGGSAGAPENTLAAFSRALEDGAEAFELDVQLTADGQVVVCHDGTVDRTTDGRGVIGEMPSGEVRRLNAAARWPGGNVGEQQIPLLSEVLEAFPRTPIIIELKTIAVSRPAVDVVKKSAAGKRVVFGAFDAAVMKAPRADGFPTLGSQRELLRLLPRILVSTQRVNVGFEAVAMSASFHGIPVPVSRYARALEGPVHIWTVNDPAEAKRLWAAGARGMVSDYPSRMLEARKSLG